ncbi:hypothetical protein FEM48_Zijuj01G0254900 [Ziziphus jujuba var. spinosa]|uniref:Pentatricopeptide repeat-containing protein n=1 Tax=Ziziphus jujuba var. spinosa TaxID=714518 RepID=A0A978W4R1_ZIZJJ|nr:hypothetical protein FEM48_Zijuj01G0254900 [Ziziphus jujuba var. spinosa]
MTILFLINHFNIPPSALSTIFVENVLGRLFAAHSNGLKALEFFKFSLNQSQFSPSSNAFEKTLHILARMRYFDKAWELMERIRSTHPSLLTRKSMSIMLSKISKHFALKRQMEEARSVLQKMHSRFSPDTKTMNILLLGFKESGDITAVELFYHEMVRRGFKPNIVTYNIRIDAYCKRGCFGDGLRLVEEMERANILPTLETITTLFMKQGCKDVESAVALMDEMEKKCIDYDSMTNHTIFFGLMRTSGFEGVSQLYYKMVERNFVPKTRTAMMLMKYFCLNCRVDLGLHLWGYMVEKGCCPHGHALDLLLTGLCSRGLVIEAFECSKQMLKRGRHISEAAFPMLEGFLLQEGSSLEMNEDCDMFSNNGNITISHKEAAAAEASMIVSLQKRSKRKFQLTGFVFQS